MSAAIEPSFVAKVRRAKKHLVDLEAEVARYTSLKPYAVGETVEGKKKRKVRRLVVTADPANTDIPIIAADAIYNLRSSLDHLMAMLVAPKDRSSAMFPVFWKGVWEDPVPGENKQRAKDRSRWTSDVKTVREDAVAILKTLQPDDSGGNPDQAHWLRTINRLSNTDRHQKLPVVATGLFDAMAEWRLPDGRIESARLRGVPDTPLGFLQNDAEIKGVPYNAMNVQVEGTPLIAVRVQHEPGQVDGYVSIPDRLAFAARLIEEYLIPRLIPYVR